MASSPPQTGQPELAPNPVLGKISDISVAFRNAWQTQQGGMKQHIARHDEVALKCRERYRKLSQLQAAIQSEMRLLEAQEALSSEAAAVGERMNTKVENDVLGTMRALDAVGTRSTLQEEQVRLLATMEQAEADHDRIDRELGALEQMAEDAQKKKQQLHEREMAWREDANKLETQKAERIQEVKSMQHRERQASQREESISRWQKMLDVRENDNLRLSLQLERKLDKIRELELTLSANQGQQKSIDGTEVPSSGSGSTMPRSNPTELRQRNRVQDSSSTIATPPVNHRGAATVSTAVPEAIDKDDDDDE